MKLTQDVIFCFYSTQTLFGNISARWHITIPTATMETGVLQLQVRSCGTAFQLICGKLTLAFSDLSGY